MIVDLLEKPLVTKRNNDVSVKMDAEAVRIAKIVAAYDNKSLAEFLSDLVLEHASSMLSERQSAGLSVPSKKSRGGKK